MRYSRFLLLFPLLLVGCHLHKRTVSGPFTAAERAQFVALHPIDAHMHLYKADPAVSDLLNRLDLHVLDILVVDDTNPTRNNLAKEQQEVWQLVQNSGGRISLCTTFDAYRLGQPDFVPSTVQQINADFDRGAVAVKIWKNIGMEIRDPQDRYLLPDDPALEPILRDVAGRGKTLLIHAADLDGFWQPPNPNDLAYSHYRDNPQWYMYGRAGVPSKAQILAARDRLLAGNPNLRVVGAHLGSEESDLAALGRDLDAHPNFAIDLAARFPSLAALPRDEVIAFMTRYQDRILYGTDLEFGFGEPPLTTPHPEWEPVYARQWRFLATDDRISINGHVVQGLALPHSILVKLYHSNAVRWYAGILGSPTK